LGAQPTTRTPRPFSPKQQQWHDGEDNRARGFKIK
jgi:hypothetical protein